MMVGNLLKVGEESSHSYRSPTTLSRLQAVPVDIVNVQWIIDVHYHFDTRPIQFSPQRGENCGEIIDENNRN